MIIWEFREMTRPQRRRKASPGKGMGDRVDSVLAGSCFLLHVAGLAHFSRPFVRTQSLQHCVPQVVNRPLSIFYIDRRGRPHPSAGEVSSQFPEIISRTMEPQLGHG